MSVIEQRAGLPRSALGTIVRGQKPFPKPDMYRDLAAALCVTELWIDRGAGVAPVLTGALPSRPGSGGVPGWQPGDKPTRRSAAAALQGEVAAAAMTSDGGGSLTEPGRFLHQPLVQPVLPIKIADAVIVDHPVTHAKVQQPVVAQPSVELPAAAPLVVESPVVEPPVVELPVVELPVEEPPVVELPVVDSLVDGQSDVASVAVEEAKPSVDSAAAGATPSKASRRRRARKEPVRKPKAVVSRKAVAKKAPAKSSKAKAVKTAVRQAASESKKAAVAESRQAEPALVMGGTVTYSGTEDPCASRAPVVAIARSAGVSSGVIEALMVEKPDGADPGVDYWNNRLLEHIAMESRVRRALTGDAVVSKDK